MSLQAVILSALIVSGGFQDTESARPAVPPVASVPAQDEVTNLGQIEVTGRPGELRERVTAFVADVAASPRGRGRARWRQPLCVGVANLAQPYAQAVVDRVSEVALDIGLDVAEPGCRASVMIFFAVDATPFAQKLVKDDYLGFRPGEDGASLSRRALEAFQTVERPVRWWQVSQIVEEATGQPPKWVTLLVPTLPGEPPEEIETRLVTIATASRLRSGLRDDLKRTIVIVDVTRLGDAGLASVADYVSMVALAQIDVDADMSGQPSILSLFSEKPAARSLTSWDMAYLKSLYAVLPDYRNPRMETRQIGETMIGGVSAADVQP